MKVSLFIVMIFSSALCFAEVPKWVKSPEKVYPSSMYIRGTGEASSIKSAQSAAVADVSLYFDTKVDVLSVAVKQTNAILSDKKTEVLTNHSYQQIANISSNAEFFCVTFTEPYYDKKTNKYLVLAYINREEASSIYKTRIYALDESIKTYKTLAKNEKETFFAIQELQKALSLSALAEQYIKVETMIVPSDNSVFQEMLKDYSKISGEIAEKKSEMTFSIIMNQSDKKFEPIFSTVSSQVSKKGYAYSVSNSKYKIVVDITCAEEEYEVGPFVRASANILILNSAGEGVYTYSKAYSRAGGNSFDSAYIRAVSKIKSDLEENFLLEL